MIQLDVKTAHLEIEEETYIKQPEGYVILGRENEVCRLKKCIYGLKQSSRVWNQKFNKFLTSFGLKSTAADPCLYTCQDKNGIILVHSCSTRGEAERIKFVIELRWVAAQSQDGRGCILIQIIIILHSMLLANAILEK
jgi:hypothetical protein